MSPAEWAEALGGRQTTRLAQHGNSGSAEPEFQGRRSVCWFRATAAGDTAPAWRAASTLQREVPHSSASRTKRRGAVNPAAAVMPRRVGGYPQYAPDNQP